MNYTDEAVIKRITSSHILPRYLIILWKLSIQLNSATFHS